MTRRGKRRPGSGDATWGSWRTDGWYVRLPFFPLAWMTTVSSRAGGRSNSRSTSWGTPDVRGAMGCVRPAGVTRKRSTLYVRARRTHYVEEHRRGSIKPAVEAVVGCVRMRVVGPNIRPPQMRQRREALRGHGLREVQPGVRGGGGAPSEAAEPPCKRRAQGAAECCAPHSPTAQRPTRACAATKKASSGPGEGRKRVW